MQVLDATQSVSQVLGSALVAPKQPKTVIKRLGLTVLQSNSTYKNRLQAGLACRPLFAIRLT